MPTSTETLRALYALQQLDSRIQQAKRSQSSLDNGTQATAQAEAAKNAAAEKRTALHKASTDLKDSELKLSALETKRLGYQQKLYQGTVTNAKELANIEREIEALGRQRSDLDSRILEMMEQAEQSQADSALADAQASQAEGHRAEILNQFRARYDALTLEIATLTPQRTAAASEVEDNKLLKKYEDMRPKMGGVGIAKIEGNACGGCHMTLPSGLIKAVKEAAEPQVCDNCGRLILLS